METERIALSQRERDRLRVLHEVKQKQITQIAAAKRLKISDRHIRRLLLRLGEHGDRAVIHGLRGRRSNRRLTARLEQKILRRVRQRYADFGPTLAAEHLAQEGLSVSRETLRKWMVKTSLWCPRAQRVKTIHVWRERRASFGELVMQDSSPFGWLEERGPACQLIAVIDDATSRFYARFTEHDTTEENLRTFGEWVRRYGRPLAHYTDKNSIFRTSAAAPLGEQLRGEKARSHFGRALRELGIEWIAAHISSGVGRTFHGGTSQAAQCAPTVASRTAAGGNSKRARGPQGGGRSHDQLGWNPLGRAPRRSVRGSSGVRRWKSNGVWMARTGYVSAAATCACAIAQHPCDRSASPSGLRPPGLAERTPRPKNKIKPKYHVPAHHPWRKPWNRTFLPGEKPDISTLR